MRIGSAEIYRQVEQLDEVLESIVIGQRTGPAAGADERIVLFVRLQPGYTLDNDLRAKIRARIRTARQPSPRPESDRSGRRHSPDRERKKSPRSPCGTSCTDGRWRESTRSPIREPARILSRLTGASPVMTPASTGPRLVSRDDVLAAQSRVAGRLHRTPLARSAYLSDRFDADIWLKLELFQKNRLVQGAGRDQ